MLPERDFRDHFLELAGGAGKLTSFAQSGWPVSLRMRVRPPLAVGSCRAAAELPTPDPDHGHWPRTGRGGPF